MDRTPCSNNCIANDHFGKFPDFRDETTPTVDPQEQTIQSKTNMGTPSGEPNKELNSKTASNENQALTGNPDNQPDAQNAGEDLPVDNQNSVEHVMPDNTASASGTNTTGDHDRNLEDAVPTNTDESIDDGLVLPDIGSKRTDPPNSMTKGIDLPEQTANKVTLPELAAENEELENDFLANGDNSVLLEVNDTHVPNFAKEMSIEVGLDRDLELELENLTFLEDQNNINNNQPGKDLQAPKKKPKKKLKGSKPKLPKNKSTNVTPTRITRSASTTNNKAGNENVPRSPKGE